MPPFRRQRLFEYAYMLVEVGNLSETGFGLARVHGVSGSSCFWCLKCVVNPPRIEIHCCFCANERLAAFPPDLVSVVVGERLLKNVVLHFCLSRT